MSYSNFYNSHNFIPNYSCCYKNYSVEPYGIFDNRWICDVTRKSCNDEIVKLTNATKITCDNEIVKLRKDLDEFKSSNSYLQNRYLQDNVNIKNLEHSNRTCQSEKDTLQSYRDSQISKNKQIEEKMNFIDQYTAQLFGNAITNDDKTIKKNNYDAIVDLNNSINDLIYEIRTVMNHRS